MQKYPVCGDDGEKTKPPTVSGHCAWSAPSGAGSHFLGSAYGSGISVGIGAATEAVDAADGVVTARNVAPTPFPVGVLDWPQAASRATSDRSAADANHRAWRTFNTVTHSSLTPGQQSGHTPGNCCCYSTGRREEEILC